MRPRIALVALLVLSACNHEGGLSSRERDFIKAMVPHHQLGVLMLEQAAPRVFDVETRRLVFEMSGYHGDELHELEHHLEHGTLVADTRYPGWIDPARLAALSSRTRMAYDVGWLTAMIEHHEGAVAIAEAVGADNDFRSFAQRLAVTQRLEIDRMAAIVLRLCGSGADAPECR